MSPRLCSKMSLDLKNQCDENTEQSISIISNASQTKLSVFGHSVRPRDLREYYILFKYSLPPLGGGMPSQINL